jgi:signal transduction histidine kinase/AmiR/NasT family two-component response regulator
MPERQGELKSSAITARRVLLIEPEELHRATLEQGLTEQGLSVTVVPSVDVAMAEAASSVDFIVIGSGVGDAAVETCKRLRASTGFERALYLLLTRAVSDAELAALRTGLANDVISEPLRPGMLKARFAVLEARLIERDACERAWRTSAGEAGELTDILAVVPDILLVLDSKGEIVFNNRGGPLATPIAPVGRSIFEFTLPLGQTRLRGMIETALTTGQPKAYDACAHDRWFTVRLFPTRLGTADARVIMMVTDITQQKQVEEALRASEAHAKAMLEALPDLYFRISRAGVYLDFRAENTSDLYVPADKIVGGNMRDLMPPEFAEKCLALIEKALDSRSVQVFELQLPMPTGLKQFEARLTVCGTDEVLAIVRDVTERKQAEAQLRAADRMASLGTLAAGMAHEINNPLAYMLLNMRFVSKELGHLAGAGGTAGERALILKTRLDDALDGAERVRRIVSDLKSFSRRDEEALGPVDVHGPIEAALDLAANELSHRARVVRCFGDVPYVHGNDKRLGQIFLNLLINAAQALPEGGADRNEIRVTTSRDAGGRVLVEIADTGSGIAPAVVEHIFDPFFTTWPEGGGTGLGLWICQRIATGLGGEISVRSELGAGTAFCVALKPAFGPGAEA